MFWNLGPSPIASYVFVLNVHFFLRSTWKLELLITMLEKEVITNSILQGLNLSELLLNGQRLVGCSMLQNLHLKNWVVIWL